MSHPSCPPHRRRVTASEVSIIVDLAVRNQAHELGDFICSVSRTLHPPTEPTTPALTSDEIPARDVLAALIYDADDQWLSTVDGTPNTYSYDAADRILSSDWFKTLLWKQQSND